MRFVALLVLALVTVGCSDDFTSDGNFMQTDYTGSVKIPLTATDAEGNTYRLRGATFEISGSAMVTLSDKDAAKDADGVVTPLPPGSYSLYLRPGFEVVAVASDGTVSNATASMIGTNPLNFRVGQMSDESLKLEFKSGERAIVFGGGAPVRVTSADTTGLEQAL
jgi:hypothetical protein